MDAVLTPPLSFLLIVLLFYNQSNTEKTRAGSHDKPTGTRTDWSELTVGGRETKAGLTQANKANWTLASCAGTGRGRAGLGALVAADRRSGVQSASLLPRVMGNSCCRRPDHHHQSLPAELPRQEFSAR